MNVISVKEIGLYCFFPGKDWVDTRSLEGEKIIESAEHMVEAKEKSKTRIESDKNKKKLLGDSS